MAVASRVLLVLLMLATGVHAASSAMTEVRWAQTPITLDGVADEEAWKHAHWVEHFSQPWLGDKDKPSHRTRAALLWDEQYLYFYAEMQDEDLLAKVTQHDGFTWTDDVFELFFKPRKDATAYYEFEVSANNTTLDMFIPVRVEQFYFKYVKANPFGWQTVVKRRGTLNKSDDKDEGWSVEGRFPWKDFAPTGGRPAAGDTWTYTLTRYDYVTGKEPELYATAPLREKNFHKDDDYAPLKFVGPTRPPQSLRQRVNWTTSRVVGSPEPPPPFRVARAWPSLPLRLPVYVVNEPGTDRLIVLENHGYIERTGAIKRFSAGSSEPRVETLMQLNEMPYALAFDPDFQRNGFVYLGCNGRDEKRVAHTRVVRYTMSREEPFAIDAASRMVIIEWPSDGHNGGDLCFGNDGMLYVTSGDGTSNSDEDVAGQRLDLLTSKVLRINVRGASPEKPYAMPADNPFVNRGAGFRGETWCYGLCNPWRMTIDRATGDIWVGENGQDLWEYARVIHRGENYGWSAYEGSHPLFPDRFNPTAPFTPPLIEHSHAEFRSLTGGVVYHGRSLPELAGRYIYGDYSTGRIWGPGTKTASSSRTANWSTRPCPSPASVSMNTVSCSSWTTAAGSIGSSATRRSRRRHSRKHSARRGCSILSSITASPPG
jgi:glucose/arabinose dehydrogenase